MGYTTDFYGSIEISPALPVEQVEYINRFSQSRRMKRNLRTLMGLFPNVEEFGFNGPNGASYGEEGEYFCLPRGNNGPGETILDYNMSPKSQPGLWCQWIISKDGDKTYIEWDGGEKFYEPPKWMDYIIKNFIAPFGCKCNREIDAQEEDHDDAWTLVVQDNVVSTKDRSPYAISLKENALGDVMNEIDSLLKRIDYANHMGELLASASPDQLDLITEIRRRLQDVYQRNKSFLA